MAPTYVHISASASEYLSSMLCLVANHLFSELHLKGGLITLIGPLFVLFVLLSRLEFYCLVAKIILTPMCCEFIRFEKWKKRI